MTPNELRAWMSAHGIHASLLARKLGVDRSTVSYWLSGQNPIPHWVPKFGLPAIEETEK